MRCEQRRPARTEEVQDRKNEYAWSDDGGKTIFKSDGSPIQWPVRAEAGPNQLVLSPKTPGLVGIMRTIITRPGVEGTTSK